MEESTEQEIVFKWTGSCRLCLSTSTEIDVFADDVKSKDILNTIKEELQFTIYQGDPLPRKLCSKCCNHLENWSNFRKTCVSTEGQLRERLHPYKKIDFVQKYFDIVSSNENYLNGSIGLEKPCVGKDDNFPIGQRSIEENLNFNDGSKEISSQPVLEPADSTNVFLETPIKLEPEDDPNWEAHPVVPTPSIETCDESVTEEPIDIKIERITNNFADGDVSVSNVEPGQVDCAEVEVDAAAIGEGKDDEEHADVQYNLRRRSEGPLINYEDVDMDLFDEAFTPPSSLVRITPWKCEPCNRYFASKKAMKSHFSSIRCEGNTKEGFNCFVCARLFFSQEDLLQHQVFHLRIAYQLTVDDLICCNQCDARFADHFRLSWHLSAVHSDSELWNKSKKFTCLVCNREFFKADLYRKHKKLHEMASGPKALRSSVAPASPSAVREFSCSFCTNRFSSEDLLYDHRFAFHGIPDERVSCETCSQKYRTAADLEEHMVIHKKPKLGSVARKTTAQSLPPNFVNVKNNRVAVKKLNRCRRCGRVFRSEDGLARHEAKQHKNRTPYFCRRCRRRFATRTHLLIHQRSHVSANTGDDDPNDGSVLSPDEDEVPDSPPASGPTSPRSPTPSPPPATLNPDTYCQLCRLQFSDPIDYQVHVSGHQMAKRPDLKCHFKTKAVDGKRIYRYHCSHCPQLFMRKSSVGSHRKLCNDQVRFIRLKRVIVRREKRPGLTAFKCSDCDTYFKSVESRDKHMLEKHPERNAGQPVAVDSIKDEPMDVNAAPQSLASHTVSCLVCFKVFSSNYISKHMRKEHDLGKVRKSNSPHKPGFKCRFCDKTCNTRANLSTHEAACQKPKKAGARFTCKACGLCSPTGPSYKAHLKECPAMAQEREIKPLPKLLPRPNLVPEPPPPRSASTASKHSSSPPTALGGYRTCPICLNTYETPNLLELHVMTAHGVEAFERLQSSSTSSGVTDNPAQRQQQQQQQQQPRGRELDLWLEERNKIVRTINGCHVCTFCKVQFTNYQAVTWHRSEHPRGNQYIVQIGDSVYQCSMCDRMFVSRHGALDHVIEHTGDIDIKPFTTPPQNFHPMQGFKCPFCSSTFASEDSIRNHIFYVHPEGSLNSL